MCLEPKTAMTTTNDNKFAFSIDKFQRFHAIIWLEVNETMSISNQIQTTAEGYRNVEKLARKTQHSDTHTELMYEFGKFRCFFFLFICFAGIFVIVFYSYACFACSAAVAVVRRRQEKQKFIYFHFQKVHFSCGQLLLLSNRLSQIESKARKHSLHQTSIQNCQMCRCLSVCCN